MMRHPRSFVALLFGYVVLALVTFAYYPRWQKAYTEATISWDVSGYYLYLPAFFIYKDAKQLAFFDSLRTHYLPTPDLQQAYLHPSGNYVFKYSVGQALQYLPFFVLGHAYALIGDHPADGFSPPYQFAISLGSLLVAFLGLWVLRRLLLRYYGDGIVAAVLLLIVLATNYLEYATVSGAMSHNYLFTLYALLLYATHRFYERPNYVGAAAVGLLIGLAALTRPTEIMTALMPLLWGLHFPLLPSIRERLALYQQHWPKLVLAAGLTLAVGFLQLLYWRYAAGEWIVYSYQDQGFSWLRPHLLDGLFSYRAGWLIYTPIMLFALIGFVPLFRRRSPAFWMALGYVALYIYIAFAWDIWWYGGSLGQRTMVQVYPLLAFPLAAFCAWVRRPPWLRYGFAALCAVFIYYNLWLTHQAHLGGMFYPEQMNRPYFWKVVGRFEKKESDLKLLDAFEEYNGERRQVELIYFNEFEQDSLGTDCSLAPIEGQGSLCLHPQQPMSPLFQMTVDPATPYIRASATVRAGPKEWDVWRMAMMIVRYQLDDQVVKERAIRLHRFLMDNETKDLFLDVRAPRREFNRVSVQFSNGGSDKPVVVDNVRMETFVGE